MKRNLKQTLEIRDTASDPKVKIQAAAIANDCYHSIMDQCWYCIRCHKVNGNKEEPTKYDAKVRGTKRDYDKRYILDLIKLYDNRL